MLTLIFLPALYVAWFRIAEPVEDKDKVDGSGAVSHEDSRGCGIHVFIEDDRGLRRMRRASNAQAGEKKKATGTFYL